MRYGKAPGEANNNMSKVGVAPWFYHISVLLYVHAELQRLFQCVAMQSKVIKGVDDEDGDSVDDEDDDDDGVQ